MSVKKRFHTIDTVRGFLLLHMVVYHALWDIVWVFGRKIHWFMGDGANIWEKIGCSCFILLSGISWRISANTKNKIRGGILLLACGVLVSAVSMLMPPDSHIRFGVLTLLGTCTLLMIPLNKLLCRVDGFVGLLVSGALFSLLWGIQGGTVAYGAVTLPHELYHGSIMTFLGFMADDFYSADYFGLLPWIFMFLCGYFLSPTVTSAGEKILGLKAEPLTFMGRHSLIIYLLHQPVVFGLLYIVLGTD